MALPLKRLLVLFLVVSVITIILGLLAQLILPPQIPLYYGLPQTSEQITPSIFIILPSLLSIIITAINTAVSLKVNDIFLKKTLAFASIAVLLLATITTYKIIFLVGSI